MSIQHVKQSGELPRNIQPVIWNGSPQTGIMKPGLCRQRILLCVVWIVLSVAGPVSGCPSGCTCTIRSKSGDDALSGRKVVCRPTAPFFSIDQIEPSFPLDTLQL